MKNITVSVDDDVYRLARVRAAELDTSVSALVKHFLRDLVAGNEFQRLASAERELRTRVKEFSAADRLSRTELHRR
jgi:plasmid stability protein